jgi:catechol 2,3-dioxygenase-like lactoylglutathione lyase family enzyme
MNVAAGSLGKISMAATTLYVSDLDNAIGWYRDKLGLEPATTGADEFRFAGYLLGGVFVVLEPLEAAAEPEGAGGGNTTVNLIVEDDPAALYDSLLARGVHCSSLGESPGFVSFLLRDLDGNRFYVTRPHSSEAQERVQSSIAESSG